MISRDSARLVVPSQPSLTVHLPIHPGADFFHKADPVVSVKLAKVERFLRVGRNDEAHLAFEIDADLTSVFSWNTKQLFVWLAAEYATPKYVESSVSVWDRIVESKEEAHLVLPFVRNKYKLVDNGAGLRGNVVNLTMGWQIMPRVGLLRKGNVTFPAALTLPEEYPEPPQTQQRRTGVYAHPR